MENNFTAKVEYLSDKGDGIVSDENGHTYFVPGCWPGDVIKYEIEEEAEQKFGTGRCIEIVEASKDRVDPICPYQGYSAGKCGGCSWMIGSYKSQLEHKEYRLHYLLKKSELFDNIKINPIVPSPNELGYRNRCQLKTDGKIVGFISPKSSEIVPIENCSVLNEKTNSLLKKVVSKKWEVSGNKNWSYLDLDEDLNIEEVKLDSRRPFLQGNNEQNSFMKSWLNKIFETEDRESEILELFAGSGNFTRELSAMKFKQIYAAEAKGPAIKKLNNERSTNITTFALDLYRDRKFKSLSKKALGSSVLIVDPPRSGLMNCKKIITKMSNLKRIVYISCNPETFIKDARFICRNGFKLEEVTPLDIFPQTHHLEILTTFIKE